MLMTDVPVNHRTLLSRAEELRGRRGQHAGHAAREAVAEAAGRPGPGDRLADVFARTVGSWRFIGIQSVILFGWIASNVAGWIGRWDRYPFILLNLVLSFQAAYSAPIIMMSANRAGEVDRLQARADLDVDRRAEAQVEEIVTLLHAQIALTEQLRAELAELRSA